MAPVADRAEAFQEGHSSHFRAGAESLPAAEAKPSPQGLYSAVDERNQGSIPPTAVQETTPEVWRGSFPPEADPQTAEVHVMDQRQYFDSAEEQT
jgi:hypothetical protein